MGTLHHPQDQNVSCPGNDGVNTFRVPLRRSDAPISAALNLIIELRLTTGAFEPLLHPELLTRINNMHVLRAN